jgi:hypothetical protein
VARDMFSIHLPTLDRPEGGKAWKLLRATMAEVLSRLSARPFFPGGTLPSGPLMPALPLCTAASIIRREWVAFSHIMPCVLVLVASIGALVLVAAVLSKFGSGSFSTDPTGPACRLMSALPQRRPSSCARMYREHTIADIDLRGDLRRHLQAFRNPGQSMGACDSGSRVHCIVTLRLARSIINLPRFS